MKNLKTYFTFSSTERKGILLLSVVVALLGLYQLFQSTEVVVQKSEVHDFHQEVLAYYDVQDSIRKREYNSKKYNKNYNSKKTFYSEKSAYNKETKTLPKNINFVIEINSASEEDFQKINGIGKVFSERIIKYRNYLGGFFEVNQLKEVYGMKPETIDANQKHFSVDATKVKRISLNQSEFKTLLKHPYLEYENVKCIFQQKNKNDTILLLDAENCVPDSLKSKIKYYFEP